MFTALMGALHSACSAGAVAAYMTTEPTEVAKDVRELLGLRGWRGAMPSEEGSSRYRVWHSEKGFVVIDLKDWEDADPKLARELATRRMAQVGASPRRFSAG